MASSTSATKPQATPSFQEYYEGSNGSESCQPRRSNSSSSISSNSSNSSYVFYELEKFEDVDVSNPSTIEDLNPSNVENPTTSSVKKTEDVAEQTFKGPESLGEKIRKGFGVLGHHMMFMITMPVMGTTEGIKKIWSKNCLGEAEGKQWVDFFKKYAKLAKPDAQDDYWNHDWKNTKKSFEQRAMSIVYNIGCFVGAPLVKITQTALRLIATVATIGVGYFIISPLSTLASLIYGLAYTVLCVPSKAAIHGCQKLSSMIGNAIENGKVIDKATEWDKKLECVRVFKNTNIDMEKLIEEFKSVAEARVGKLVQNARDDFNKLGYNFVKVKADILSKIENEDLKTAVKAALNQALVTCLIKSWAQHQNNNNIENQINEIIQFLKNAGAIKETEEDEENVKKYMDKILNELLKADKENQVLQKKIAALGISEGNTQTIEELLKELNKTE